MSVGIELATADYFSIWCKCKADERYDTSQTPKNMLVEFQKYKNWQV